MLEQSGWLKDTTRGRVTCVLQASDESEDVDSEFKLSVQMHECTSAHSFTLAVHKCRETE